jgi:DNA gyrase subunit A
VDEVVSLIVVPLEQNEQCMVLTACENGFGKRTPVSEYRLQRRGGSGVINIKTTERNGNVIAMKAVCDTDELMMITQKGILIRTRVEEIRETGRNAQGVKLIRLDEGDKLVAMCKVDAEDPKTETEAAATGDAEATADPAAGEDVPPQPQEPTDDAGTAEPEA